ncbi:MAG: FHA domain-containing protein [Chitinispirillaceae bacterium]|nr:FHA domain-containing protein [Chitinispirillaceae bacterium]
MDKLFLVRYPEAPLLIASKKSAVIGRAEECDIVLAEARVSRRHAIIEQNKSSHSYAITDLGSSNGTYVNNSRIAGPPLRLNDRDKIRIASAVFTVRIVDNASIIMNEFNEIRDENRCRRTEILPVADASLPALPCFAGDLSHLCPLEIFQMLESGGDNQGTFTFSAEEIPRDNPEITMPTTFLLMEGCRLLDEAAR